MKLSEVRRRAEELGVDTHKKRKNRLILDIQYAEGYDTCFGSRDGDCPYHECCFKQDCKREFKKQYE